jgi:hypothetical protein
MEASYSGSEQQFTHHLLSEGESVPWTPREILEDVQPRASSTAAAIAPFVVHVGPRLLMVEADASGWTLAELEFSPRFCFFQEKRRANYSWPREAFGAMMSRLSESELASTEADRLASDFAAWLGSRFSHQRSISC